MLINVNVTVTLFIFIHYQFLWCRFRYFVEITTTTVTKVVTNVKYEKNGLISIKTIKMSWFITFFLIPSTEMEI